MIAHIQDHRAHFYAATAKRDIKSSDFKFAVLDKNWQHRPQALSSPGCICAGSTSAKAAKKLGYKNVYSTDTPGLHGFLEAIEEALAAS